MKGAAEYRKALIEGLLTTRWPRIGITDAEMESLAKELGVQLDVLREARARVNAARAERGTPPVLGRKKDEKLWPQLEIDMPSLVFEDWHAWCERQCGTSNALARGLLHMYLLGTWEPKHLATYWLYKGQRLPIPKHAYEEKNHAAWPYRERVLVSQGARGALTLRAERLRLSATAIVRGLVLDVLEGRIASVAPMEARLMYHDATRYTRHLK